MKWIANDGLGVSDKIRRGLLSRDKYIVAIKHRISTYPGFPVRKTSTSLMSIANFTELRA